MFCALAVAGEASRSSEPQADKEGAPVTVLFRALTSDGHAITDIKPEELTLKIQGRARTVRSLKLIQFGDAASERKAGSSLPAPYSTNEAVNLSRTILLIVDDESMTAGRERPMKDAVLSIVASASPQDRIGLMTVPRGGTTISPTPDRTKVEAAIETLRGRASLGQTPADSICRTIVTLESLRGLFESYYWESLTTMVYLSGGISPAGLATAQMGRSSDVCELRREDFKKTADAALQAPIDLYVAYVPDDSTLSPATNNEQLSGLENLSGLTGNQLLQLGGTSRPLMERLFRETGAYYLLSFDPEASERNNGSYRVELKTSREKIEIRAKPEVTISKGGSRSGGSKGPTTKEMLRVASSFRELPLRVTAYIARDSGDKVKLVTVFEPNQAGVKLNSAGVALFDDKGKLFAQTTPQASELAGGTVVSAIPAKAGSYRLRIAAIDAAGRRGAIDQELRLELEQSDSVKLSTMVLGRPAGESFAPALQFGTELTAIGYIEVYGVPKAAAVTATFELATTANGPAVVTVPAAIQSPKAEDARLLTGEIPIGGLMPGDFTVRVVINVDGRPVGRAARTLRKVLK